MVDPAESEADSSSAVRKRKVTKRVQPDFYHSVQVTPTRRPVGAPFTLLSSHSFAPVLMMTFWFCLNHEPKF